MTRLLLAAAGLLVLATPAFAQYYPPGHLFTSVQRHRSIFGRVRRASAALRGAASSAAPDLLCVAAPWRRNLRGSRVTRAQAAAVAARDDMVTSGVGSAKPAPTSGGPAPVPPA